jgi:hypothetical protein
LVVLLVYMDIPFLVMRYMIIYLVMNLVILDV